MNVMKEMATVFISVTTLLVATSATVKMDTYWTLMNTLAMVSLVFYSYACCNFMEINLYPQQILMNVWRVLANVTIMPDVLTLLETTTAHVILDMREMVSSALVSSLQYQQIIWYD